MEDLGATLELLKVRIGANLAPAALVQFVLVHQLTHVLFFFSLIVDLVGF